jgi:hypothetical protein
MDEPALNPYQSPTASLDCLPEPAGIDGASRPAYKLYTVRSITLATFLATPIAGGVVMAINYRRLGRDTAAIHAVVWTIVATVTIIVLSMLVPDDAHIPDAAYFAPQLFGMYVLAKQLQGHTIDTHRLHGGALASAWGAAGIALLVGLVIGMIIIGVVFAVALLSR